MNRDVEDYYFKWFAPEPYKGTVIKTLYEVKLNQIRMMKDRQFEIDPKEEEVLNMNIQEFIDYYESIKTTGFQNALSKVYFGKPNTVSHGMVTKIFYIETPQDKKQTSLSKELLEEILNISGLTGLIVISQLPLSSVGAKNLASLVSYRTQSFTYDELINDVTKNYLTSTHILMTQSEEKEFLKSNRLNKSQIGRISIFDPINKWNGGIVGNIYKLIRTNISYESIVPQSISYRVVVDIPLMRD